MAYSRASGLEGWRFTSLLQSEVAKFSEFDAFANAEKIQRIHSLVERRLSAKPDGMPDRPAWAGQQWPQTEPLLCRVDDGIPNRVGRTEACGNAVGSLAPELIGRAILAALDDLPPPSPRQAKARGVPPRPARHISGDAHATGETA